LFINKSELAADPCAAHRQWREKEIVFDKGEKITLGTNNMWK